ncbi:MAG TPA: phenylacetate-CoA oxygenase/reductase subunit PaaK [Beijerinckiaceae bacterium]|nr:phenylacetate-CoA oxygenase/reductase subunit PaaK [Beijerinckiaceae bacterium]
MSRFHPLSVKDIRRETADSVSLVFNLPEALKQTFSFTPGQYLTLRTMLGGTECRRSYSICSGLQDGELRIAVKKVAGGVFSTFANEKLKPGAVLDVLPPEGRFVADPARDRHLVFFAAGSGITPVLSIIRSALAGNTRTRISLFYGNRTTASIMFREALEDLKDRYLGRLSVFHILSRESQDIDILNGRIDQAKVALLTKTMVPPAEVDAYFLCGPYSMVEEGRAALTASGVDAKRIKAELFSTDGAPRVAPKPSAAHATGGVSTVDCQLDGITYHIEVRPDERIVDSAHAQGVELPYSCKGGMCCTCRCKVTEGKVTMDANYSLEPWEMEAGFVLACQSRPQTPVVKLDFDAS